MIQDTVQDVIEKRRIEEVMYRYCRAIDRCDEELLLTTFHDDAGVDMGVYQGSAKEFCSFLMPYLRDNLDVAIHRLTNVLIEVNGDTAKAESYMPGCAIGQTDSGLMDFPDAMRYLDRFEKRGGEWRIAFRYLAMDWNAEFPASMTKGDVFETMTFGHRDRNDPSYEPELGLADEWTGRQGRDMENTETNDIDAYVAKQALHEVTARFCRGVDRADVDILRSVWHEGATVDFGYIKGSAEDFCKAMTAPDLDIIRTIHCVSNELFLVDGDKATGESYLFSISMRLIDGEEMDTLVGGRYLDRFERRKGEWRLVHRTFVMDWNMNQPSTSEWEEGRFGVLTNHGKRDKSDPVYTFK